MPSAPTVHNKMRDRWRSMIRRCTNHNAPYFKNYGGRGISVCDRWRNSFDDFIADMGYPPAEGMSLDRINNDGNYEPGNVRWATSMEQNRNSRSGMRDLSGRVFGRLTVQEYAYSRRNGPMWHVLCECGKTKIVEGGSLTKGLTRSCGCLSREVFLTKNRNKRWEVA